MNATRLISLATLAVTVFFCIISDSQLSYVLLFSGIGISTVMLFLPFGKSKFPGKQTVIAAISSVIILLVFALVHIFDLNLLPAACLLGYSVSLPVIAKLLEALAKILRERTFSTEMQAWDVSLYFADTAHVTVYLILFLLTMQVLLTLGQLSLALKLLVLALLILFYLYSFLRSMVRTERGPVREQGGKLKNRMRVILAM